MKKLVRDNYVGIIGPSKLSNIDPSNEEEIIKYLSLKLREEVTEFIETDLKDQEEFADIFEVLYAIVMHMNLDLDAVDKIATAKNASKGSFRNLVVYDDQMDIEESVDDSINNGGRTDYYDLPKNATDLQDLIEAKGMNFAQGNIFKAMYRSGVDHHSSYERDLNKIIYFAERELKRIKGM